MTKNVTDKASIKNLCVGDKIWMIETTDFPALSAKMDDFKFTVYCIGEGVVAYNKLPPENTGERTGNVMNSEFRNNVNRGYMGAMIYACNDLGVVDKYLPVNDFEYAPKSTYAQRIGFRSNDIHGPIIKFRTIIQGDPFLTAEYLENIMKTYRKFMDVGSYTSLGMLLSMVNSYIYKMGSKLFVKHI